MYKERLGLFSLEKERLQGNCCCHQHYGWLYRRQSHTVLVAMQQIEMEASGRKENFY